MGVKLETSRLKIFNTRADLSSYLSQHKTLDLKIGLVPTMGALHKGHISLVELAKKKSDLVVCSIFINPTQFNNEKDLTLYPRTTEEDINKLKRANCHVLFLPDVAEMYNEGESWNINLGGLDQRLEGEARLGHYQGVTQIVKKFLDLVKPDFAFFGQKDYQQFLVISKMVKKLRLKTNLVMCPIVREKDGLAMSSRNVHLSMEERKQALALNSVLEQVKKNFNKKSIKSLVKEAVEYLNNSQGIVLDYFEICNGKTLKKAYSKNSSHLIALVAAKVGKTRLIDNIILQ